MNIQFRQPSTDDQWDKLVLKLPNYSFLLSSARFKYVQENFSNSFRFLIYDNDQFVGILTGIVDSIKIFGKYIECKHNPILIDGLAETKKEEILREVFKKLKVIAKENKCFFARVSPLLVKDRTYEKIYEEFNTKKSPVHPQDALISQYFDISKSKKDLRHDMSSSTRNNINKLLKNDDVWVKVVTDDSAFDIFKNFYKQTKEFKGYRGTQAEQLLKELQYQVDRDMLYFVVGYFKKKPIAVWQNTRFGKYMHTYQAGSDIEFREKNVRITYLLFWESIKLCKKLGVETLDLFGGMVPERLEGKDYPWKGVNDFKKSLGGRKVTYMHPRDIPIKSYYNLYFPYAKARVQLKGHTTEW